MARTGTLKSLLVLGVIFIPYGNCGVVKRNVASFLEAADYLRHYGYMPDLPKNLKAARMVNIKEVESAIKDFQHFAHIEETGTLDNETVKLMNTPRCGVNDRKRDTDTSSTRKKRYVLQGSRWTSRRLSYKILKYPSYLSKEEVDRDIRRSFDVWSEVANISFYESNAPEVNIDILFVAGEHGDKDPFDGPGGTLAHAFFPIYGGDVHFDVTEDWTTKGHAGTNLYQVATHEFGHSLGLSHTDIQHALMAPFYRGYVANIKLHDDDIEAIQALYGPNPNYHKKLTGEVPTAETDSLCGANGKFDSITMFSDDKTYIFKGSKVFKLLDQGGIVEGYPHLIADEFVGLPSNIDAVFTWVSGATYVFKGCEFWKLVDKVVLPGYPRKISIGFPGVPCDVDTASVWGSRPFFFKGDVYYKYDPTLDKPSVAPGYPKSIRAWKGVPSNLDGALLYKNGWTYFFKDGEYFRFNDKLFRVDSGGRFPFPRRTETWWLGCHDNMNKEEALVSEER